MKFVQVLARNAPTITLYQIGLGFSSFFSFSLFLFVSWLFRFFRPGKTLWTMYEVEWISRDPYRYFVQLYFSVNDI